MLRVGKGIEDKFEADAFIEAKELLAASPYLQRLQVTEEMVLQAAAAADPSRYAVRGGSVRTHQGHHLDFDWDAMYDGCSQQPYMLFHYTTSMSIAQKIAREGMYRGTRRFFYFRGRKWPPGLAPGKYRALVCVRTSRLGGVLRYCRETETYFLESDHVEASSIDDIQPVEHRRRW